MKNTNDLFVMYIAMYSLANDADSTKTIRCAETDGKNMLRHFDAVKTLVCSLVLSRLDYCNSLLLVSLSILLRDFKEFKMRQTDQYLEHPDLSTSHHTFPKPSLILFQ